MDKLIPYLNHKQTLSDTGDYTYSFICKCGAVLDLELSKEIHYNPKCLKCNSSRLQLRYSIILGDLWMNDEILRDQGKHGHSMVFCGISGRPIGRLFLGIAYA